MHNTPKAGLTTLMMAITLLVTSGAVSFAQDLLSKGIASYSSGDYATALREFRLLAETGSTAGQWWLGSMWEMGEGVPQDFVYAHMWFNISARDKYIHAVSSRRSLERKMTSAQIAEAQKLARECVKKQFKGC